MTTDQSEIHNLPPRRAQLIRIATEIDGQFERGEDSLETILQSASELSPADFAELERVESILAMLNRVRHHRPLSQSISAESIRVAGDSTQVDISLEESVSTDFARGENDSVGRFKIEKVLGQGGYARVFLAHDPHLDRKVALKIPLLKTLGDSAARLRFEREAKAAAVLNHPAIVPIYESGTIGAISFIAFAYCEGSTLGEWFAAKDQDISPDCAAAIVARLAEAVEHAHQRGIIHRDLKPANVLLESHDSLVESDAANRVRITDFGLARFESTGDQTITMDGAIVGTPAYMSPEQARGDENIGPASDVFALGAILYELLTGTRPFAGKNHLATLRAIETETPLPPRQRNPAIPKDVEAICLKCLEKDPKSRYESAFALSADLNRWRDGLPIQARSASAIEKLYSWSRRNSAFAIVCLLAIGLFLAGFSTSLWQWRQARRNLADAKIAIANEKAERQRVQKIVEFLGGTYRSPDPTKNGRDVRVVEILSQAESEIETTFANDPVTRRALLRQIGAAYSGLGLVDESIATLQVIVDEHAASDLPPSEESILSSHDLAIALQTNGEFDRALSLISEVLKQATDFAGAESKLAVKVLTTKAQISQSIDGGVLAIPMYQQILDRLGESADADPIESLNIQAYLGDALLATGKAEEAQQLLTTTAREIEALVGANHPSTLAVKNTLANALRVNRNYDDLTPLRAEIASATAVIMGPKHPKTIEAKHNYAANLMSAGKADEAIPIVKEVLKTTEEVFGKDNLYFAVPSKSLAAAYELNGQPEMAQDIYEFCYEQFKSLIGLDHARTRSCISAYRANLRKTREWKRLEVFLKKVADDQRAYSGDDDSTTWIYRGFHFAAIVFSDPQQSTAMLEFADEFFEFFGHSEEANQPQRTASIFHGIFIEALLATGQHETALPLLERYVELGGLPEADSASFNFSRLLGAIIYAKCDQTVRAADLLSELTEEKFDPEILDGYQRHVMPDWLSHVLELAEDDQTPLSGQRDRIEELQEQIIASRRT